MMKVLKLNLHGIPVKWISYSEAATTISKDLVAWSLGNSITTLRGGMSSLGLRSTLDVPAIIAVKGHSHSDTFIPLLTNSVLFRRDNSTCMYCGREFPHSMLTRDHVVPRGQGGLDRFENVVASCGRCNSHKGCRTPEEANMPLLAVPFTPNPFEEIYLRGHKLAKEQYAYLSPKWSNRRQWAI